MESQDCLDYKHGFCMDSSLLLRQEEFINSGNKVADYESFGKVETHAGRTGRKTWPLPTTSSNIPCKYCQFGFVNCLKAAIKFAISVRHGITREPLNGFHALRVPTFCKFLENSSSGDDMLNVANRAILTDTVASVL